MTPREQFKKFLPDHATTLRGESQRPWFLMSLTFAQAAVVDRGATIEEINGINRFIEQLTQLAAEAPKIERLPVKTLQVLDGGPAKPKADGEAEQK